MQRTAWFVVAVLALVAPAAGSSVILAAGAVNPSLGSVNIRVELDRPNGASSSGPAVYVVTADLPAPSVDLTAANLVSNPSHWVGSLDVHLDLNAQTITVSAGNLGDFQTAKVIITGLPMTSLTVQTDTLWDTGGTGHMSPSTIRSESQPTELIWTSMPDTANVAMNGGGTATFAYTTATLSAAEPFVPQGESITVTGTDCVLGTGSATIGGPGGVVSVSDVVADNSGTWTANLSTTGLAPNLPGGPPYVLEGFCTSTETGNFTYVSTLFSVAPPTTPSTTPTTSTAPPAVPATPNFTG